MSVPENTIPARMTALSTQFQACRSAFIALGDENRQHILITLLQNFGGMRVGRLAAVVNLSRPAVSRHLKILMDAGIVTRFRVGTMNFYHVDANESRWAQITELVETINTLVREIAANGDGCPLANRYKQEEAL